MHASDPWKYMMLSYGNLWQNLDSEFYPLRLELIMRIESDLELPGLPIIRIGILFIKQTNVVNTFYLSEKLIAILSVDIFSLST